MTTKYLIKNVYNNNMLMDMSLCFQIADSNGANITTGYITGAKDLGKYFKKNVSDASGNMVSINTGLKYYNDTGVLKDIGPLFLPSFPFIATGAKYFGITTEAGGGNFYWSAFLPGSGTKTIQPNSQYGKTTNITFVCVGGGGGGGRSAAGHSNGGGGGGGAYKFPVHAISKNSTETLTIIVGSGGASDTAGGDTVVQTSTNVLMRCTGGGAGTYNAAGMGGQVYQDGVLLTGITGGNGGDQSSGEICTYYVNNSLNLKNPLNVEQKLTKNAISKLYVYDYYSGGGGGGKSNNEDYSYSNGKGGVKITTDSSGKVIYGGLGGLRGDVDVNGSVGENGQTYGAGGGAGGFTKSGGIYYNGGQGGNGIVIAYALLY